MPVDVIHEIVSELRERRLRSRQWMRSGQGLAGLGNAIRATAMVDDKRKGLLQVLFSVQFDENPTDGVDDC
jgi:hypothetical protein